MLYAKHTLQIIKKFIRTGSLLEIGAGAGYFLDEARKEGFDVYGIELNNIQANFIRNKLGIPCEESPLDVSSFCEKKFDIIYHCDVISHFFDPIAEFKNIHDTLLDNGIVVFETGNVGDIKEKYYRIFASFHYPDHMFFFSENNLMELLRLTGFEFIRIYRYSILTQLLFNKILKRVMDSMKSQGKIRDIRKKGIPEVPSSNINGFNLKQLARIAFYLFSYLIRYKIGYIMPKKGRPQTVIIIARKIK
jgi:SAM-dependent methyltransferase